MSQQVGIIIPQMRLSCVLLVLASAHLVMAPESTFQKSLEFAGCYELHVSEVHQSNATRTDNFLPRRFQLTMRPSTVKDTFVVRTLDPKVGDSSLIASMSSWNVNLDGTLRIVWNTGYVGYDVRVTGSGPELRGTAHFFTDTDPLPRTNRDRAVVARRVGCKESEK
jgi:hypothetical protein